MYSPVRVSTLMLSPFSMKSGTCTTAPVSRVAGFNAEKAKANVQKGRENKPDGAGPPDTTPGGNAPGSRGKN